jgi:peptide/nickel transport system permease protein
MNNEPMLSTPGLATAGKPGLLTGPLRGDYGEKNVPDAKATPMGRTMRRFMHHKLAMVGAIILILMAIAAILAPLLAPHDPNAINLMKVNQGPTSENWLGTDAVGRDTLSRAIYGARISMTVGFLSVAMYLFIGFVLGATAGYTGGTLDNLIMRFTDVMMCFPTFVLTLILVGFLGPSVWNIIFVIGLFGWPGVTRLVRGQVLQLRTQEFVQAAEAMGASRWYILWKHLAPNIIGPMTVAGSLGIAGAILQEAGLSFLGFGVVQPTPSWGAMLNEARNPALLADNVWLWMVPGALISLAVLSSNFIGDGLRDAFDVRGKGDV